MRNHTRVTSPQVRVQERICQRQQFHNTLGLSIPEVLIGLNQEQQHAPRLHSCAIDGTFVRGAGIHGRTTLLVSLVDHTTTQVYAQTTITGKRHERRAIPGLLADRGFRHG